MSQPFDKRSTERFTGLAEIYARARPSYPDEAIQSIIETALGKSGAVVADVGCGTGISSRLFAARGYQVIGIEPNDDMRRQAEQADYGGMIDYRCGTAESTLLEDGSIDLVVCAQAFHWFHPDRALREFARVLRSGGWVALMWNERDETDAFTRAYGDALRIAPETAKVEMHRGQAGQPLLTCALFTNAHKRVFVNVQTLNQESVIQRALSASYAPRDPAGVAKLKLALETAFSQFASNGSVDLVYETSVYLAQLPQ